MIGWHRLRNWLELRIELFLLLLSIIISIIIIIIIIKGRGVSQDITTNSKNKNNVLQTNTPPRMHVQVANTST